MDLAEPIAVTVAIVEALDKIGVRYLVGGSLASSMHGIPRSTQDVDIVADLKLGHAVRLARERADTFYVDADMIREAVVNQSSFNVIHLETMFKADIFVLRSDDFALEEMNRAHLEQLGERQVVVASAEDIVLEKLRWYRMGDAASDRQLRDVLGVLTVQAKSLDFSYLRTWAAKLGLGDLLKQALDDAGITGDNSGEVD